MADLMSAEAAMEIALMLAQQGVKAGEPPFGAAILDGGGQKIAGAHDMVNSAGDMTRHAEVEAIRMAVASRGPDLSGCTLATTVEPCPMCFTAAWLSRISRIVYGTTMSAVADATRGAQREVNIPVARMNELSGNEIELIGGVLGDACLELFLATSLEE